jgi:hypothetical protein
LYRVFDTGPTTFRYVALATNVRSIADISSATLAVWPLI